MIKKFPFLLKQFMLSPLPKFSAEMLQEIYAADFVIQKTGRIMVSIASVLTGV